MASSNITDTLLEVEDLNVYYGAIHALKGISFHLEKGEIVALIGANGAGKSTTLNTISGLLRPRVGTVTFEGEDITQTASDQIVQKGIIQVPEGRKIFATLYRTGKPGNGRIHPPRQDRDPERRRRMCSSDFPAWRNDDNPIRRHALWR